MHILPFNTKEFRNSSYNNVVTNDSPVGEILYFPDANLVIPIITMNSHTTLRAMHDLSHVNCELRTMLSDIKDATAAVIVRQPEDRCKAAMNFFLSSPAFNSDRASFMTFPELQTSNPHFKPQTFFLDQFEAYSDCFAEVDYFFSDDNNNVMQDISDCYGLEIPIGSKERHLQDDFVTELNPALMEILYGSDYKLLDLVTFKNI